MKIYKTYLISFACLLFFSCSSGPKNEGEVKAPRNAKPQLEQSILEGKGIGETKTVQLTEPLNENMIAKGKTIYDMKCLACHQLSEQRIVGPGFQGVTNRRRPEWIMNMMTNPEEMVEKDPAARAMFEEFLSKMPNQNITTGEAREILEFLRKNDLEKTGKKDEGANI